MYFQLSDSLVPRIIEELRRFWQTFPLYRDSLVIQGKFSFTERPQHGMIVKGSGSNKLDLSPDNYQGMVDSYCLLTKVKNKPGLSVEWLREDSIAIQRNRGVFPSLPGHYYLDVRQEGSEIVVYVDPLLQVTQEIVPLTSTSGRLRKPPVKGSVRLVEMPNRYRLLPGVDYTLVTDATGTLTGEILLSTPIKGGRWVVSDYLWVGDTVGPLPVRRREGRNDIIPGVVLGIGDRLEAGDQLAVMVHDLRRPAYLEYGGKWETSMTIDIMSRDVQSQRELTSNTLIYLWGVLRSRLQSMGISITNVSDGGEAEEIYDQTGDDYFYTSNISLTLETDWSVHVPVEGWLRQVNTLYLEQFEELTGVDPADLGRVSQSNVQLADGLGLELLTDPFWSGRRETFEVLR